VRKTSRLQSTFLTAAAAAGSAALVYAVYRLLHNPVPVEASIPVLLLAYVTYRKYFAKVEASTNHIEELSRLYLATIESLTMAIDAKDQMAQGHIRRVRGMAEGLARAVGYPEEQMEGLKAAALLHDIGKLAIPEHILNKPAKLSPAEFSKIMIHPVVGADILSNVEFPYEVVPIVKHHHERFDGTGYPDELRGEQIPLGARILAIVDCYDALTHKRPHRPRFTQVQALEMMRMESGRAFDPVLLEKFLDIVRELDEASLDEPYEVTHSEPAPRFGLERSITGNLVHPGLGQRSPAEKAMRDITSAQREVLSLYEISQTLGSTLRLSEVLAIIAAKLEKVTEFTTLVIYLLDDDVLRAAHVDGRGIELIKGMKIKMGEGETGWAAETRQVLICGTPVGDLSEPFGRHVEAYRSAAIFPLQRQDTLVGALALYSEEERGYSTDDVRLLETISRHAADAVFNALAFERTHESALTDTLTGLPNSRFMYGFFEQERSRADRLGYSLILMMMDLDGFKKINDTYGHHVGDDILRRTAQTVRRRLRLGDTLVRYAGDEFVAVLHDATEEVVQELKERLQEAVDNCAHEVRFGRVARVGISIGYATYQEDGYAIDELMEIADQRMYQDKIARKRNGAASRVVASSFQEIR
jgi:diguanylate cyclase (GGDEF)-like protein/putative nucleotidyltransferase with HDIG domain